MPKPITLKFINRAIWRNSLSQAIFLYAKETHIATKDSTKNMVNTRLMTSPGSSIPIKPTEYISPSQTKLNIIELVNIVFLVIAFIILFFICSVMITVKNICASRTNDYF